jgi:hypothetical protein
MRLPTCIPEIRGSFDRLTKVDFTKADLRVKGFTICVVCCCRRKQVVRPCILGVFVAGRCDFKGEEAQGRGINVSVSLEVQSMCPW